MREIERGGGGRERGGEREREREKEREKQTERHFSLLSFHFYPL